MNQLIGAKRNIAIRNKNHIIKDMDVQKLARYLKTKRLEKGLTREELAPAIHISAGHLNHVERGLKVPSFELLMEFAREFDVSSSYLFSLLSNDQIEEGGYIKLPGQLTEEDRHALEGYIAALTHLRNVQQTTMPEIEIESSEVQDEKWGRMVKGELEIDTSLPGSEKEVSRNGKQAS